MCLHVGFGCDEFWLTEACSKSSNMTEGGSRSATFVYGWDSKRQKVSSTVEPSVDGVSVESGVASIVAGPMVRTACTRPSHTT